MLPETVRSCVHAARQGTCSYLEEVDEGEEAEDRGATKEAVAAEAMAETEKRVPMFIMVPASSMDVIMFWLACTQRHTQPASQQGYHSLHHSTRIPLPNSADKH